MLADFQATPRLDGPCAAVEATWRDTGERPGLRIVRRGGTYPERADDGRCVVDLDDLLAPDGTPWARVSRLRCVLDNSGAEGGLLEAELVLWFAGPEDQHPAQARVAWYSSGSAEFREERIDGIVAVEHAEGADGERLTLLVDDDEAPVEAGRVEVASSDEGGGFTWRPAAGRTREVAFHRVEVEHTTAEATGVGGARSRLRWPTLLAPAGAPLATAVAGSGGDGEGAPRFVATLEESLDADSGDWRRRLSVADRDVAAHTVAYYRLFARGGDGHRSERQWTTWALPTPPYGSGERMYGLLPAVHQRLDEPDDGGEGQLRRFLSVLGLGLDHIRGYADGLRARHDLGRAAPDQLAQLSRWVGWEPDRTAPVRRQRSDVAFAPAVYDTVGTADNLRAVIKRAVGWESETKEFADNVLLSNAPEPVRTWELWSARRDGDEWVEREAVTDTSRFDGRPAAVVDGDGDLWLFWESDRTGRRTVWLRRDDAEGPVLEDAPEWAVDEHPAAAADGDGAVWLFWSSDRGGSRCVWRLRCGPGTPGQPEQVTTHAAPDAYPAVAADGSGELWLFWQSSRRGPTDIWCRLLRADGSLGPEERVTTAEGRHETPAAAFDPGGRLWVFWASDTGGRRSLWARARDDAGWGEPQALHSGPWRDEAPCAVVADDRLCLVWHSDRGGHWDLWQTRLTGDAWADPAPLTEHAEADKEPCAAVVGGQLRVWWRSQRGGARRRSRTLDTDDATALAAMGTLTDHVHYTYDTGRGPEDWYARDTVGVALKPTGDVADPDAALERIVDYVEPFRPLPVRLVWLSIPARHEDVINTDDLIQEEHSDAIE